MAVSALHSASTGLSALSTELDVLANNLANVNNTGFKRSRVNFEDLLYQVKEQPGIENDQGAKRPMGTIVGLGTRVSGTQLDFTQGSLVPAPDGFNWAIDGPGFFQVEVGDLTGSGFAYTRTGEFFVNSDNEIVLGNSDGRRLEPGIIVPDDATDISIGVDGRIYATVPTEVDPQELGQVELVRFVNMAGLRQIGGDLFVETNASGPFIAGVPGEAGFGTIKDGFLEASNVDPVRELVDLIKTQRAFEMNSQTIQAADETLQVVSNLRRF